MLIPVLSLLFIFSYHLPGADSQFLTIDPDINTTISFLESILDQLPSSECTDHFVSLKNGFMKGELWAMKMLDATAKPQAGIFLGNVMHVGNYDECLEINSKADGNQVHGKYCTVFFEPHPKYGTGLSKWREELMGDIGKNTRNKEKNETLENARLSYGFCIPKVCTQEILQNITNILENAVKSPLHFNFDDKYCDGGDNQELSPWAIFSIIIFSMAGLLLVSGTMYEVLSSKKLSETNESPNLLIAFSVLTNSRKLFSTKTSEGNLDCLNGLRVISMMWIVLSHSFLGSFYFPHVNSQEILVWVNKTESSVVVAPEMAVDTFFVISGLLVMYLVTKSQAKGVKFSLPMFYFHRILRLTPSLAMVVLLTSTLVTHMGNGPFWPVVKELFQEPCEKYWWSTLLYVQNYVNPNEQCMAQSWYLAVDTQMYFLSPLIFFPLIKWPKQTIGAIAVFIVLNCSYVFEITWKKHLGTTFLNQDNVQNSYIYSPTHVRGTVYLIGMVCGYFIYKTKTTSPLKLDKVKTTMLWLFSLTIMITIVVGHAPMMSATEYNPLESSLFNSLIRVGWALALSVIIILCINGYGGLIDSFLSHNIFNILIRLNYNVYLLHIHVLILTIGQERAPSYFSDLVGLHRFWGDYMFSLGAALIWTLAFESPIIVIEKFIFNTKRSNKATNDSRNIMDGEKSISTQIVKT